MRYKDKCNKFCDGIDPFTIKTSTDDFPVGLNYLDIMRYVIDGDSHYTENSFKSYKSLSSYKLYKSGWVQEAQAKKTSVGHIIIGKVCSTSKYNSV